MQEQHAVIFKDQAKVTSTSLPIADISHDFKKSAGYLRADLEPMSENDITALKDNFESNIHGLITGVLPKDSPTHLYKASYDYCIAASRKGMRVKGKDLKNLIDQGRSALKARTRELKKSSNELKSEIRHRIILKNTNPFGLARRAFIKLRMLKKPNPIQKIFGSSDRVYFNINDQSMSPHEQTITNHLSSLGYTDINYQAGYAKDNRGNKCKIGKALKDSPKLACEFANDTFRGKSNTMVVLTRDVEDIARGSYDRGWRSCRASAHSAASNGVKESATGVLAAYLVTKNDPYVHNPLGRVFIKPYSKNGQKFYKTFNPIGLHSPAFVSAVNRFVDSTINAGIYGTDFRLSRDCESFREMVKRTHLPKDPENALLQLKIKYEKKHGKIIIKETLDLNGLGLSSLPDFSDVVVETGIIDVSNNKLLSLVGLPQEGVKHLNVSKNLISSMHGAPSIVEDFFNYSELPYLLTASNAPQAQNYLYGKGKDINNVVINPADQPEKFTSFKRS